METQVLIADILKNLKSTLDENEIDLLDKLMNYSVDLEMRASYLYFKKGIQLAYRLGQEVCNIVD